MSDNEEKLYTNGGFKKQKKQKKQGEEEEDGLYGCEELKVKLYKNPFALTNEQVGCCSCCFNCGCSYF